MVVRVWTCDSVAAVCVGGVFGDDRQASDVGDGGACVTIRWRTTSDDDGDDVTNDGGGKCESSSSHHLQNVGNYFTMTRNGLSHERRRQTKKCCTKV